MAQYAELAPQVPRLLDMVDVDSAKWSQYAQFSAFPRGLIWRLEARRLASYESRLKEVFDKIVLTTENEVAILESISPGAHAGVVRVGVDLKADGQSTTSRSQAPTLVFTGQMDYFANVDGVVHFAREVFPKLRAKSPDLRFLIVGRSPTREVVSLSRLPGVKVTGEVDDVGPYLAESWVFVAPLRIAQGVQIKVLQAMAMGLPAVVSERVMAGLADGKFQDGRDLMVATDDLQLEKALDELLRDEGKRRLLSASARSRLADRYCWEANMLALEHHLEDIARSYRRRLQSCERGSAVAEAV
jgi:sugar transferase (PEP-CTERM/EpsH1 system associated)